MDRIQRSHEEAAQLRGQPVSEVTPSRRDFGQYVTAGKDEPAVIARVTAKETGWNRQRFLAYATASDDAEVAALSLSLFDDLLADDLGAISAGVAAPILREDPLVDSNQLYHSRVHGADAVVLPITALDPDELSRLVDVSVSMHLGIVIECANAEHLEVALRWPYTIVGVRNRDTAARFGKQLPPTRTIILLSAIRTPEEYEAARGLLDAVVVGPDVLAGDDLDATIRRLRGHI